MFVLVGRPKILEELDFPLECSVTARQCQPLPGHLAGADLGPTGCKWALEPRSPSQPLPTLGLPAWTCSFPVYHALVSFTRFLTFCYRMRSAGGGSGTGPWGDLPVPPPPPLQPPQASQWAELGSVTETFMACLQTEGRNSRGG